MQCTCPLRSILQKPEMSGEMNAVDVDWKAFATKAALTGGIAAGLSWVLGNRGDVSLYGRAVPGIVPMAIGAGLGSVAADLSHSYVMPLIPHEQKYDHAEAALLGVGASAAGTAVAASLMSGPPLPAAAVGAVSYVGADWVSTNIINKSTGGMLY